MSTDTTAALPKLPLDAGTIVGKKYRIDGVLGEGGTGIVALATHVKLEQKVAIKFLRPALASPEVVIRFDREARAISKIQCEHVVTVIDVGALDDGAPYMVMEFLDGSDLGKVLKTEGCLPLEEAVDCMLQVCEALKEAHAAGIIHRDLKPANLFLTRNSSGMPFMKVVDFGISKIKDAEILEGQPTEMTKDYTLLGSPRFMAPEQLRSSKDVDARSDLWSVGAVLYQLITGKYAFDGESNMAAGLNVVRAPAPSLQDEMPDAPAELDAIIKRCLEKDPANRFQSARELSKALEPFATAPVRESLERIRAAKEEATVATALEGAALLPESQTPSPGSTPPSKGKAEQPITLPKIRIGAAKVAIPRDCVERPEAAKDPGPKPHESRKRLVVAAAGVLIAVLVALVVLALARSGPPAARLPTGTTSH